MHDIIQSWIVRLFVARQYKFERVQIRQDGLYISNSYYKNEFISFKKIIKSEKIGGFFWSQIHIYCRDNCIIFLKGISNSEAYTHSRAINTALMEYREAFVFLINHKEKIIKLGKWLENALNGIFWLPYHQLCDVIKNTDFINSLKISENKLTDNKVLIDYIHKIRLFKAGPEEFRSKTNEHFIQAELDRFRDFFDKTEKQPLTFTQRLSIITHEDNTRVVAGAGSGKTSVMVVKAAYLITKSLCQPHELLMIAFNRSAAEELRDRTEKNVNIRVKATTFHALGLEIIAQVTGKKPSLAKSAEDNQKLNKELLGIIENFFTENLSVCDDIRSYFQSHSEPYKSLDEFKEIGDYYNHLKKNNIRSIRNELMRSMEEVEIANFLFLNGIEYYYEHHYEIDLANREYRQYQPDFYLPKYEIYIEHFGISRSGTTAPTVDENKYHEGMKWKRSVHQKYGTILVETFSYMKKEGTLSKELKNRLASHGVKFSPISNQELYEELKKNQKIDPFCNLLATFLNHFKGNSYHIKQIREIARERNCDSPRLQAFLRVFEPIYSQYEANLRSKGEIDFNDMITQAAHYVRSNTYQSPYTCILVDEFQDISVGRARLIKGLVDQKTSHRLFCVGDDWQAIYRFAGSDIALMRDFQENFGFTETVNLDRTFRFNDRIERVASRFIQMNPAQLPKTIHCATRADQPRVIVHQPTIKSENSFLNALAEIQEQVGEKSTHVQILGRYNFVLEGLAWYKATRKFPNLSLTKQTVHSAKGTQADYVIVVGMTAGRYGFPSEIIDDPILNAVLSKPEPFAHAEERRLFYVALTRARHAVHLLVDPDRPSQFVEEIIQDSEDVDLRGAALLTPISCPECITGRLLRRTSNYGLFYSCSNYPLCDYKANTCKYCNQGVLVRNPNHNAYICSNHECHNVELICPACDGSGRMTERKGPYGSFYGCTNYAKGVCQNTMPIQKGRLQIEIITDKLGYSAD